jgi:hypothetical protein
MEFMQPASSDAEEAQSTEKQAVNAPGEVESELSGKPELGKSSQRRQGDLDRSAAVNNKMDKIFLLTTAHCCTQAKNLEVNENSNCGSQHR